MHALADENLIDYATGQSALPTTRSGAVAPSVAEDTFLSDWLAATVAPTPHSIASLDEGAEVTDVIVKSFRACNPWPAVTTGGRPDSMQSRLMAILGN